MKGFQRLVLGARWGDILAEVFAALEKPLQQVEEFLRQAVQSSVRDVTAMALHLLSAGGKRLRPALTLMSAQFAGNITPRAIIFAAVVELMHTATLVLSLLPSLFALSRCFPSMCGSCSVATRKRLPCSSS